MTPDSDTLDAGLHAILEALTSGDTAEDGTPGEEALDHAAAILDHLHGETAVKHAERSIAAARSRLKARPAEKFCGGKGSKRPGPCPEGDHNAHVVSGAHLNAAKSTLAKAQAAHTRSNTSASGLALSRARIKHRAAVAAHAQATKKAQDAGNKTAGHAYLPLAKRASRANLTPEKRREVLAKLAKSNFGKKSSDNSKKYLTPTGDSSKIPPVATKTEPETKMDAASKQAGAEYALRDDGPVHGFIGTKKNKRVPSELASVVRRAVADEKAYMWGGNVAVGYVPTESPQAAALSSLIKTPVSDGDKVIGYLVLEEKYKHPDALSASGQAMYLKPSDTHAVKTKVVRILDRSKQA